jgi:hypothetical protein
LGLEDNKVSRKFAERKARDIELDIISGNFDPTLAKYKPQVALSTVTPTQVVTLAQLWEKYTQYKTSNASVKTINKHLLTYSSSLG